MIICVKRLLPLAVLVCSLDVGSVARGQSPESGRLAGGARRNGPTAAASRLYEHVRRSVVLLEQSGLPPSIGTVLGGDGRILTSMSALGGAEMLSVRYSDGTTVRATVSDADPIDDLALLKPEAGRGGVWTEGLAASEADPVGAPLRVMLPGSGARVGVSEAAVRRRIHVRAGDGQTLPGRLDVDLHAPAVFGAPLVDGSGGVVGVLTRACFDSSVAPAYPPSGGPGPAPSTAVSAEAKCRPVLVGAPVQALRAFIVRAGTAAGHPQRLRGGGPGASDGGQTVAARTSTPAWLGIRGESEKGPSLHGVRVVAVAPSSPAEKAGLRAGTDVIASVDGKAVDAPEKVAEIIANRAAGDTIQLVVVSGGELRTIQVVLMSQE